MPALMTRPSATFSALLYLPDRHSEQDTPNLSPALSVDRRAGEYLAMASRLGDGVLRHFGRRLTVLTNRSDVLVPAILAEAALRPGFCSSVDVLEIPFDDTLPHEARHFSASQKLHAFRHLAGSTTYSILLDLDMICRAGFSDSMQRRIATGTPLVFDISEQVFPSYSYERVAAELALVSGRETEFRWYGGEFIGGTPAFFADLFRRVEPLMAAYREVWPELTSQGEEVILSAALSAMRTEHSGDHVCDVAPLNVVRRHWAIPTIHDAPRLRRMDGLSFIHLPAMKPLLASTHDDRTVLALVRALDHVPERVTFRARSVLFRLGRTASLFTTPPRTGRSIRSPRPMVSADRRADGEDAATETAVIPAAR
jgi:hypothetical protein